MAIEQKAEMPLEMKLAEPFLDGIKSVTNELKVYLAEAKKHSSDLNALFALAQQLEHEHQGATALRLQLDSQADYSQVKNELSTLRMEQSAFATIFPDHALTIFGIGDRKDLTQPDNLKLLPVIFAWLTFVEWSQKEESQNFVAMFRKVDAAVWEVLQKDERLEKVRANIAGSVRNVIDRALRAGFEVNWSFVGQGYEESQHHSESGGGTTITVVKTALITRDGEIRDKARVECK